MNKNRKLALIVSVILGITCVISILGGYYFIKRYQSIKTPVDPQRLAYEKLKADSDRPPEMYFENGFPRGVHVDIQVPGDNPVERARYFLDSYQELYLQSDPDLALGLRRVSDIGEDITFYQTYKGNGAKVTLLVWVTRPAIAGGVGLVEL